MEDWITKKPDAMVFVPVDYKALVPMVQKADAAGIPIINYNNKMAGGKIACFIGSDDEQMGYDIARFVFKAVGDKGKVVISDGVPGASTAQDRHRGFMRALGEVKGMELLAAQPANYSRLQAEQVMENLLQRFPEIDVVLAANDEQALGSIEAIDAAGRLGKIKVTGCDATPQGIQSILQGRQFATLGFSGFDQGYLATEAAYRLLKGEKLPQHITLPVPVVETSMCVGYFTYPPGAKSHTHHHTAENEVYFVLQGELTSIQNGRAYRVPRNGLVFIPKGVSHYAANRTRRRCIFLAVHAPVVPDLLEFKRTWKRTVGRRR
jgi:ribose transport system substrate-binding protein